jgi:fatty acid desaturase
MRPEARSGRPADQTGQSGSGAMGWRQQYRLIVSLLIIPLGLVICVRALLAGWQAWSLLALGLAFVALGLVRLHGQLVRLPGLRSQGRKSS